MASSSNNNVMILALFVYTVVFLSINNVSQAAQHDLSVASRSNEVDVVQYFPASLHGTTSRSTPRTPGRPNWTPIFWPPSGRKRPPVQHEVPSKWR